jgi:hypothetical protein
MESAAAFQGYMDHALELLGIEADETERMVMAAVWALYEPGMEMLRDADLDEVEPEHRLDLAKAPSR